MLPHKLLKAHIFPLPHSNRIQIFYLTFCVPLYTPLVTTHHVFFSFLIKYLRFKMKTNQTQFDTCYIVVDGV